MRAAMVVLALLLLLLLLRLQARILNTSLDAREDRARHILVAVHAYDPRGLYTSTPLTINNYTCNTL